MWYKVKISRDIITDTGKEKSVVEYYICDSDNFAEAGYKVMSYFNGDCEVEDVCVEKSWKPCGNQEYDENNKVFIVKFAQDMRQEDGTIKVIKYPVPFYANNNDELQKILTLYIQQGLDGMRVVTVSETQWKIIQ